MNTLSFSWKYRRLAERIVDRRIAASDERMNEERESGGSIDREEKGS